MLGIARNRVNVLINSIKILWTGRGHFGVLEEAAMSAIYSRDAQKISESRILTIREFVCYSLRYKYQILFRLAAWGLIFVHTFETPSWTYKFDDPHNQALFPNFGVPYLPVSAANSLNLLFVVILSIGISLEFVFEGSQSRRIFLMIMTFSVVIKFLETLVNLGLIVGGRHPISLSPIEAISILLVERRYQSNIPYLFRILPPFVGLLLFLSASVSIYTAFGYLVFDPGSMEMRQFFPTYGTAMWNMLMVLDGSNWPIPMMPAYDQNRLYALYFVIYIVVVNWGFLNLTLGFIFTLFQIERKKIMSNIAYLQRVNLKKSFSVLDQSGRGYLFYHEVAPLVMILYQNFEHSMEQPPSEAEVLDLVSDLDMNKRNKIYLEDFLHLREKCFENSLRQLRAKTHFDRYFSVSTLNNTLANLSILPRMSSMNSTEDSLNQLGRDEDSSAVLSTSGYDHRRVSGSRSVSRESYGRSVKPKPFLLAPVLSRVQEVSPGGSSAGSDSGGGDGEVVVGYRKMSFKEVLALPTPKTLAEFIIFSARVVDSTFYDILMDCIVFTLGLILLVLQTKAVFYVLVAVALLESLSKLAVKGVYRYRKSYRNSFDGLLSFLLLVATFGVGSSFGADHPNYKFAVETVVILRMILFPRNIFAFPWFAETHRKYFHALNYAISGASDFLFLMLVLFTSMYTFAGIGQAIFGGMIRKYGGNAELLSESYFGEAEYFPLNFNDMFSGMATLFVLLHVNNMHVTASGFTAVTSDAALIFFVLWWTIGVLLLLNVLTAYLLTQLIVYVSANTATDEPASTAPTPTLAISPVESAATVSTPVMEPDVTQPIPQRASFALEKIVDKDDDDADDDGHNGFSESSVDDIVLALSSHRTSPRPAVRSPSPPLSAGLQSASKYTGVGTRRRFSQSIFASNETRTKLNQWVTASYEEYRQSLSVRPSMMSSPGMRPSMSPDAQRSSFMSPEAGRPSVASRSSPKIGMVSPEGESIRSSFRMGNEDENISGSFHDLDTLASSLDPNSKHGRRELHASMHDWVSGNTEMTGVETAAALIQFARDGGNYTLFSNQRALTCFRLRQRFAIMFRVCSWLLLALKIFERPYWTFLKQDWNTPAIYPMSGIYFIPVSVALGLKIPIILVLLIGLLLEFGYKENGEFRVSYLSPMVFARYSLMLYCMVQFVVLFYVAVSGMSEELVVMSSAGSCIYIFWFDKRAFVKLKFVKDVLSPLSMILMTFLLLVLFFAALGPLIFNECKTCDDDDFNRSQFETYADSVWSIFVAITSSSYPGQVMPLYRRSRLFFFYFFSFISLGAYGVLNLCLLVVLYQYNRAVQRHADLVKVSRDILMLRAFQIMDREGRGYLDYSQTCAVLNELYNHYADFRKAGIPSASKQSLLVRILDLDGDGQISPEDFSLLIDVTRIKLKMGENETFLQARFTNLSESQTFQQIFKVINSRVYIAMVDFLVVGLLVVDLSLTPDIYEVGQTDNFLQMKLAVLIVLLADSIVKYLVNGHREYFKHLRNRVDLFIAISFLFVMICFASLNINSTLFAGIAVYAQIIELLRVMLFPRVFRVLLPDGAYSHLSVAVRRILRSVYKLLVILICALFSMATLGQFLYGGLISTDPSGPHYDALVKSQFGINGLWTLNFNDMPSSFVTLFSCLHVSDFDVIASGFVAVTTTWSRVYFTVWYVFGVLLLLNIVKSYFLNDSLIEGVTRAMSIELPSFLETISLGYCKRNRLSTASTGPTDNGLVSELVTINPLLVSIDSKDSISSEKLENGIKVPIKASKQFVLYFAVPDSISSKSQSNLNTLSTSLMDRDYLKKVQSAPMAASLTYKKYYASTEYVKDLDEFEKEQLDQRLTQLQEETSLSYRMSSIASRSHSTV